MFYLWLVSGYSPVCNFRIYWLKCNLIYMSSDVYKSKSNEALAWNKLLPSTYNAGPFA